jgi:hypothetical protein
MAKFVIFSTEQGPSVDPQSLVVPLTYMVVLDRDPIVTGSYDPHAGSTVRGSVIPTLGGVVVQDFGPQIQDQRITFSDEACLAQSTITSLIALYELTSTELYFTDGYDCWLVQFARPQGFLHRRNLITSHFAVARYDYEISLVVKG